MIFITNEDELKIDNGLTALYFYADWLPFHKKMKIMFDKVEDIYKDINFLSIDIDSFKTSCIRFKIESIPTVLLLNNNGSLFASAFETTDMGCKVFRSDDNGTTWTAASNGLTNSQVLSFTADSSGCIYLGSKAAISIRAA